MHKTTKIYVEGHLDKNCFEEIYRRSFGIKPEEFEKIKDKVKLYKRDPIIPCSGKEDVYKQAKDQFDLYKKQCIIIDFDTDTNIAIIKDTVVKNIDYLKENEYNNPIIDNTYPFPNILFQNNDKKLMVILSGFPEEKKIKENSLNTYCFEDHIIVSLKEITEATDFEKIKKELDLTNNIPDSLKKLDEVIQLSRKQGIIINDSKQILNLLHGIAGFKRTTGWFYSNLIRYIPDSMFKKNFAPLVEKINSVFDISEMYNY